jgi:hypothetical protein
MFFKWQLYHKLKGVAIHYPATRMAGMVRPLKGILSLTII